MHTDGLYPPMTYSPIWLVIGLVTFAGTIAWGFVVWWLTRQPKPQPAPEPPAGWRLQMLKADYIAQIDEVVRLETQGQLSHRRAHQELSLIVRQFVEEASGLRAPTMTLSELGHSPVPSLVPVTDVVLRLYPVEFGPETSTPVWHAADLARGALARWT